MGRRTASTLSAVQPQRDARVQASPEHIPFPYLFLAISLSSFMSLHSRISPPAPSFSCCPGFSNVAPGKLRENGRESVAQHLPPCTLSLPLLPVWAGLPEGSQAFKAEGREHSPPPPSWGMGQPPREWGERGKASPPALAEGERVQHCHRREQKQEKERWRMVAEEPCHPSPSLLVLDWATALGSTQVPFFSCSLPGTGLPLALKLGG